MKKENCGPGSNLVITKDLRDWIADLCRRYAIRVVNDCGCGTQNWVAHVDWKVDYAGYDRNHYTSEYQAIEKLDFTEVATRKCDMILCKDALRHLPNAKVEAALDLFRQSAVFLLTDYDTDATNKDMKRQDGKYCQMSARKIDVSIAPFNLGDPLESIESSERREKRFGLWKLR